MAVQPLNKTKIIKKQKKHPNRFQSDRFLRVKVSQHFIAIYWTNNTIRLHGDFLMVLIAESEDDSRETKSSQRLDLNQQVRQDT